MEEKSDAVELSAFDGVSLSGSVDKGLGTSLSSGGIAGGRVTWNATSYIGLEFSYNFMVNNVRFLSPISPGLPTYSLGNQTHCFAFSPVFDLLPRGYRVQPFITVSAGFARFPPTDKAKSQLSDASATFPAAALQSYITEGSVANETSPNAAFDASFLSFESGARGQTKAVTATFTVANEAGKSVRQTTQINISCPPQFVRLPDVVFAKIGSRVNNCGKRILIDEAAPRLAAGDYDVVPVGH